MNNNYKKKGENRKLKEMSFKSIQNFGGKTRGDHAVTVSTVSG
jgi:hypothetical protein